MKDNTLPGPDYSYIASSLNNLSSVLQAQGQYHEAQRYYEQAFVIYQQVLGSDHPYICIIRGNLAALNSHRSET